MSILIQRARMVTVVVRLGQLVFQQHEVGRVGTIGSEPDPRFGDTGVGVVTTMNDISVVVPDRMFFPEQMIFDPTDVVSREIAAISTRVLRQNTCDVVDIAVVAPKTVVSVLGPFECREIIAWTNRSARVSIGHDRRCVGSGDLTGMMHPVRRRRRALCSGVSIPSAFAIGVVITDQPIASGRGRSTGTVQA
ncbi:hypothetical protein [Nocardia vermiculata]|uniref:hypothetical protein n=1 Tax=Nocardia vermiculata TaxID=257274 RepID=UPI001FE1F496|nr:hypothetical protein [Nocardia vermiculata]